MSTTETPAPVPATTEVPVPVPVENTPVAETPAAATETPAATQEPKADESAPQTAPEPAATTPPAEQAATSVPTEAELADASVTASAPTTETTASPTPEVSVAPSVEPTETTSAPVISSTPAWPSLDDSHPLAKFQARLPELLKTADHKSIWGITLSAEAPIPFHTTLILQKFLRANYNNVDGAYNQLLETLKWRKLFNPESAIEEVFSESKFGGLGYVTKMKTKEGEKVITWNIYGACKDPKKTFGDLNSFLRWRIALMELGVNALELPKATVPIPDYNAVSPGSAIDPYQMIQLHDYMNVSFFRLDSATKAASKKTIDVMAHYYPELLSSKLFVNVPVVMGWVFNAMKAFLSKETLRKFKVISSGKSVVQELGDEVPKVYGGKGADLTEVGLSPKLIKDEKEVEKKASKKEMKAEKDAEKLAVQEDVAPVPASTGVKEDPTAAEPTQTPAATATEATETPATATTSDVPPTPPAKDEIPATAAATTPSEAPVPPSKDETPAAAPAADSPSPPTPPAKDEPVASLSQQETGSPADGKAPVEDSKELPVGSEPAAVLDSPMKADEENKS